MTREEGLFALARNAFRAALPSENETQAAARRLVRRLRERTRRKRFAPLLSVAFALAGALAYAAGAAHSLRAPAGAPAPVEAPRSQPSRVTLTSAAPAATNPIAPATALAASPARTTPHGTPAKPSPSLAPSVRPPATWAAVARALANGDERAARRELERLSINGNARDRANAAVELARFAAHRGDCSRARKHLARARANLGGSPSLTRAEEAVRRCESSPRAASPLRD